MIFGKKAVMVLPKKYMKKNDIQEKNGLNFVWQSEEYEGRIDFVVEIAQMAKSTWSRKDFMAAAI